MRLALKDTAATMYHGCARMPSGVVRGGEGKVALSVLRKDSVAISAMYVFVSDVDGREQVIYVEVEEELLRAHGAPRYISRYREGAWRLEDLQDMTG